MGYNLRDRNFTKLLDFSPREIRYLLDLSRDLKRAKYGGYEQQRMKGKNIAVIFEKTSTRTRVAFEVAAYSDQGAHVTYLGPSGTQIGHKESMKDTARVLGRIFDGIEYRGFGQEIVEELAQYAGVPVWNGLTDQFHPTQILADFLTMQEHSDKPLHDISYCYFGDARNNMGDSLMLGGAEDGDGRPPSRAEAPVAGPELVKESKAVAKETGGKVTLTDDPAVGAKGVDFLYTDVWVSMGEADSAWEERIKLLKPYQVNSGAGEEDRQPQGEVHALPARVPRRNTEMGEEIFEKYGLDGPRGHNDVFESERSIVWDQAENRMHTIKAIMVATRRGGENHMRVVVALGGNALSQRGQPMTAEVQRENVRVAAEALARWWASTSSSSPTATGRRSGCLPWRARRTPRWRPTRSTSWARRREGMIGYLIEQELGNRCRSRSRCDHAPHHGRGGPRGPGLRQPDEVRRARSTTRPKPNA